MRATPGQTEKSKKKHKPRERMEHISVSSRLYKINPKNEKG